MLRALQRQWRRARTRKTQPRCERNTSRLEVLMMDHHRTGAPRRAIDGCGWRRISLPAQTRFRRTNYLINRPAKRSGSKFPASVNGLDAMSRRTVQALRGNFAAPSPIRRQCCLINWEPCANRWKTTQLNNAVDETSSWPLSALGGDAPARQRAGDSACRRNRNLVRRPPR